MARSPAATAVLLVLIVACAKLEANPARDEVRVSDGRPAMGTILEISLYAPDAALGRALMDELFSRVAALEAELTSWDAASATSRLNAAAGSGPSSVPPALRAMLTLGVRASRETEGLFDVTIGPLIRLWQRAGEQGILPSAEEISAARSLVGVDRIELGPGSAALAPGTVVSFDGLAKGWALDRLGEMLETAGTRRALLDFGGSSWLARGAPPGETGWRVLIANQAGRHLLTVLRDESLSVSESLGQGVEIGGRFFGHVIDPRSGWPVAEQRLAAVRAASGADAEVWSTALLVFSAEAGRERIEERDSLEALWIEQDGALQHTEGFLVERALGLHGSAGR